jgi:type 1 glutamine amidotransferase
MRALIVTGGIFHDFAVTGPRVADILRGAGFAAEVVPGMGPGLARFMAAPPDLLVIHALAWSMMQDEKYVPYRTDFAWTMPAGARAAVSAHLAGGKGLLGLHTAAICFDDWPEWGSLLGAAWVWGRSHHPAPCPVRVTVADPAHPVTAGTGGFTLPDELYCDLALAPDATVLATGRAGAVAAPQPVLTVREGAGGGRAVWSALGHDAASFAHPAHAALLARAARWAARIEGDTP